MNTSPQATPYQPNVINFDEAKAMRRQGTIHSYRPHIEVLPTTPHPIDDGPLESWLNTLLFAVLVGANVVLFLFMSGTVRLP